MSKSAGGADSGLVSTLEDAADIGVQATPLDEADARRLTQRIHLVLSSVADQLDKLADLVAKAKAGDAHIAMGYRSWPAYVAGEFADLGVRLNRDDRRELVASLATMGMSTRAIAQVVGMSQATVNRDRPRESDDSPAREVTGMDGKVYEVHRREPTPEVLDQIRAGEANLHRDRNGVDRASDIPPSKWTTRDPDGVLGDLADREHRRGGNAVAMVLLTASEAVQYVRSFAEAVSDVDLNADGKVAIHGLVARLRGELYAIDAAIDSRTGDDRVESSDRGRL
jgi:hypothetical protein